MEENLSSTSRFALGGGGGRIFRTWDGGGEEAAAAAAIAFLEADSRIHKKKDRGGGGRFQSSPLHTRSNNSEAIISNKGGKQFLPKQYAVLKALRSSPSCAYRV